MKKNRLLLKTKNDIPFIEARVSIHQPTIREIALIGEQDFHVATRFLMTTKDEIEDKVGLEDLSDFDIIMSIVQDKSGAEYKAKIGELLTLLFPDYTIKFTRHRILLLGDEETEINNVNFQAFRENVSDMFCLEMFQDQEKKYNPARGRAEKIAEKLRKGAEIRAKKKGKKLENDLSLYEYYISILAVGEQKSWNELLEYTVPQLIDEFKRYQRKIEFDYYRSALLAGATNLDEVKHWMVDEDKNS